MNGLYRWDMDVFRAINVGWQAIWLDHVSAVVSISGLGILQAFFVLGLYPWPALRRLIAPTVAAIAVSGILLADVAKLCVHRDRPSVLVFAHLLETERKGSFPSGHTATSFGLATMLLLTTIGTRRWWIGPGALLYATAVGLSRIYQGVHWPTDVLAGASAGAFGAGLVHLVFARRGWLDLTLTQGTDETGQKPVL